MVQCYSTWFSYSEDLGKDVEFEVVGDAPEKVGPKQAEDAAKSITNGSDDGAQPSTSTGESWPPGQQVVNLPTKHDCLEQTDYFMNVDHKVELCRTTRGACWFGIVLMKL